MTVKDRVAVITGSGQGIGAGIAIELAKQGAKVVINDVNEQRIEETVASLNAEFGEGTAIGIKADITKQEEAKHLIDNTVEQLGKIDILVNNAGIAKDKTIRNLTEADWDSVLDVNLKGTFLTCQAASFHMIKQNYGRIINISSRAWLGFKGQANYSASKGGVVSLSRTLALELAKYQITVNTVCPGIIRTPLFEQIPEEGKENLMKLQPTKSVGEPKDIGYSVAFLASDKSSYVTGQTLFVCGGKSLFSSLSV